MKNNSLTKYFLAVFAPLAVVCTLHAQITWDGNGNANVGGNWSTGVNWDTNAAPITGNTAILDTTGANRTITYDAAASGALGTLTINQTSAFLNQLAITRASGLNVANAITLGATGGGTAEIRIGDINNTTAATYLTAPSITLNSGGLLNFQVGGNATANTGTPTFNGSLTIAGGTAGPLAAPFAGATSQGTITGNVTMTSGTFRVVDAVNPATVDARMQVQGIFNATGGTLLGGRFGNQLALGGSSQNHTIGSGVTITGSPAIALLSFIRKVLA